MRGGAATAQGQHGEQLQQPQQLLAAWMDEALDPDTRGCFIGPFRENVLEFMKRWGEKVSLPGLTKVNAWVLRTNLVQPTGRPLLVHVYEERLQERESCVCDPCRNMGWQHHPVSNRKYHFIIPGQLDDPSQLPTKVEDVVAATAGKQAAKSSGSGAAGPIKVSVNLAELTVESCGDDAPFNASASVFDSYAHCLHGVIHANGYGHLLRVNGKEGGSTVITGSQVMAIWDRICYIVCAREVSVEDVSNKSGMLLRLLHSAAHCRTWYGKWGYHLGRAPYGVTNDEYQAAVTTVNSAPLDDLVHDFKGVDMEVPGIVARYQAAPEGEGSAHTLGQLLQHMLRLVANPVLAASYLKQHPLPKQQPVTGRKGRSRSSTAEVEELPAGAHTAKIPKAEPEMHDAAAAAQHPAEEEDKPKGGKRDKAAGRRAAPAPPSDVVKTEETKETALVPAPAAKVEQTAAASRPRRRSSSGSPGWPVVHPAPSPPAQEGKSAAARDASRGRGRQARKPRGRASSTPPSVPAGGAGQPGRVKAQTETPPSKSPSPLPRTRGQQTTGSAGVAAGRRIPVLALEKEPQPGRRTTRSQSASPAPPLKPAKQERGTKTSAPAAAPAAAPKQPAKKGKRGGKASAPDPAAESTPPAPESTEPEPQQLAYSAAWLQGEQDEVDIQAEQTRAPVAELDLFQTKLATEKKATGIHCSTERWAAMTRALGSVLQEHAQGTWLARPALQNLMCRQVNGKAVADTLLKVAGNTRAGGWAIYRALQEGGKASVYRAVWLETSPPDDLADALLQELEEPSAPPAAAKDCPSKPAKSATTPAGPPAPEPPHQQQQQQQQPQRQKKRAKPDAAAPADAAPPSAPPAVTSPEPRSPASGGAGGAAKREAGSSPGSMPQRSPRGLYARVAGAGTTRHKAVAASAVTRALVNSRSTFGKRAGSVGVSGRRAAGESTDGSTGGAGDGPSPSPAPPAKAQPKQAGKGQPRAASAEGSAGQGPPAASAGSDERPAKKQKTLVGSQVLLRAAAQGRQASRTSPQAPGAQGSKLVDIGKARARKGTGLKRRDPALQEAMAFLGMGGERPEVLLPAKFKPPSARTPSTSPEASSQPGKPAGKGGGEGATGIAGSRSPTVVLDLHCNGIAGAATGTVAAETLPSKGAGKQRPGGAAQTQGGQQGAQEAPPADGPGIDGDGHIIHKDVQLSVNEEPAQAANPAGAEQKPGPVATGGGRSRRGKQDQQQVQVQLDLSQPEAMVQGSQGTGHQQQQPHLHSLTQGAGQPAQQVGHTTALQVTLPAGGSGMDVQGADAATKSGKLWHSPRDHVGKGWLGLLHHPHQQQHQDGSVDPSHQGLLLNGALHQDAGHGGSMRVEQGPMLSGLAGLQGLGFPGYMGMAADDAAAQAGMQPGGFAAGITDFGQMNAKTGHAGIGFPLSNGFTQVPLFPFPSAPAGYPHQEGSLPPLPLLPGALPPPAHLSDPNPGFDAIMNALGALTSSALTNACQAVGVQEQPDQSGQQQRQRPLVDDTSNELGMRWGHKRPRTSNHRSRNAHVSAATAVTLPGDSSAPAAAAAAACYAEPAQGDGDHPAFPTLWGTRKVRSPRSPAGRGRGRGRGPRGGSRRGGWSPELLANMGVCSSLEQQQDEAADHVQEEGEGALGQEHEHSDVQPASRGRGRRGRRGGRGGQRGRAGSRQQHAGILATLVDGVTHVHDPMHPTDGPGESQAPDADTLLVKPEAATTAGGSGVNLEHQALALLGRPPRSARARHKYLQPAAAEEDEGQAGLCAVDKEDDGDLKTEELAGRASGQDQGTTRRRVLPLVPLLYLRPVGTPVEPPSDQEQQQGAEGDNSATAAAASAAPSRSRGRRGGRPGRGGSAGAPTSPRGAPPPSANKFAAGGSGPQGPGHKVLVDLKHLYTHVLREYCPMAAAIDRAGPKARSSIKAAEATVKAARLRLANLAQLLLILVDSKYFVKDYGGPLVHPLLVPWERRVLRVQVKVALPKAMHLSWPKLGDGRDQGLPPRTLDTTPQEYMYLKLPTNVGELRRWCGDALSSVYRMFKPKGADFKITSFHTGLPPHLAKLPAWQLDQVPLDLLGETARPSGKRGAGATDAGGADVLVKREGSPSGTRGQHHQGHAADAGHIPGAVLLPDGVLLVVSGVNIDTDKKWRHAGGPEEWRVLCDTCGTQDDDGERMIACDVCGIWMHTRCSGIRDDEEEPSTFVCNACSHAKATGK